MMENKRRGNKRTITEVNESDQKRLKTNRSNEGHTSAIEVIELSDTEEILESDEHDNLSTNDSNTNESFISELNGEGMSFGSNPNQIFLTEDYELLEDDDSKSNIDIVNESPFKIESVVSCSTNEDTLPIEIETISVKKEFSNFESITEDKHDIDATKSQTNKIKIKNKVVEKSKSKGSQRKKNKSNAKSKKKSQQVNVNSDDNNQIEALCLMCRKSFESLEEKEIHEQQCYDMFHYYRCKFCSDFALSLSLIQKHLIEKHSLKGKELEESIIEIGYKKKAVKLLYDIICQKLRSKEQKNSTPVDYDELTWNVEVDVDKKFADSFDRINELIRTRCCKCKVVFEWPEKQMLLQCPNCKVGLIFSCQLCGMKVFSTFGGAWLHISYRCKELGSFKIMGTEICPGNPRAPQQSQTTYDCAHCTYKALDESKFNEHMESKHYV